MGEIIIGSIICFLCVCGIIAGIIEEVNDFRHPRKDVEVVTMHGDERV